MVLSGHSPRFHIRKIPLNPIEVAQLTKSKQNYPSLELEEERKMSLKLYKCSLQFSHLLSRT